MTAPRALLLAACVALSGCASAPKVRTQLLVLPSPVDPLRLRTLTVLPLDGEGGELTARLVQEAVSEGTTGEGPWFVVHDRRLLAERAPDRLAVAAAPPHSTEVAAQLGRELGVKGVWMGRVFPPKVEPIETDDTRCEETDARGNCTREMEVHCVSARATFGFLATLVDVDGGRVVLERAFYGNAAAKERCRQHDITGQGFFTRIVDEALRNVGAEVIGSRRVDERPLLATAQLQAVRAFAAAMVPHLVAAQIELMRHDGIRHAEAKRVAERALGRVHDGVVPPQACNEWEGAQALAPQEPSIAYNLGVCAEVNGKAEQALERYRLAAGLPNGAGPAVTRAVERVERRVQAEQTLRTMGR